MKKIILLVDDDFDLRTQIALYLKSGNYEVIEAESEKEGNEYIETKKFDAAVLDLMMENKDSGLNLAYKIKKNSSTTPVIIVTGVTRETGMVFETDVSGKQPWIKADLILQKDVRKEQLLGALKKLLNEEDSEHTEHSHH